MFKFFSAAFLIFLVSCFAIKNGLEHPKKATKYTTIPTNYYEWWEEISDCASIKGNFNNIKWYSVENGSNTYFDCKVAEHCEGLWVPYNRIYIISSFVNNERIVKHEMLHYLLSDFNVHYPKHHRLFSKCHV